MLPPGKQQARFRQQPRSGLRQHRIAGSPTEQLDVEIVFQRGNQRADGGLRLAQVRAAAENEPWSAEATKASSCSSSMLIYLKSR